MMLSLGCIPRSSWTGRGSESHMFSAILGPGQIAGAEADHWILQFLILSYPILSYLKARVLGFSGTGLWSKQGHSQTCQWKSSSHLFWSIRWNSNLRMVRVKNSLFAFPSVNFVLTQCFAKYVYIAAHFRQARHRGTCSDR